MSQYIPENDYNSNSYKPFKKLDGEMCNRCEAYYKMLYEKGLTKSPFPPKCEKSVQKKAELLSPNDFDTLQEYIDTTILFDPVAWAMQEFGWTPRFYQKDMLSCTSNRKLYRLGRRTGKTEAMVIEALYMLTTNKNYTILVAAPFERQITRFFDELDKFIAKSVSLKGSLSRYTKTPSRMDFQNGSKILGFSVGSDAGSGSDKIRGQDANLIIIDEMDFIEDKDLDVIMAILASRATTRLIAATTPAGWRRKFYSYVTQKDAGFKEFWFISAENPEWTPETESLLRSTTDAARYSHEYYADFAEIEDGVFKSKFINASIQHYDLDSIEPVPGADYILGVDWNKTAGTHMVIMEKIPNRLRVAKKIIIEESEYTQTAAVESIIMLNRKWRFKWIFIDRGYGQVQYELLRKHSKIEPSSLLDVKLIDIAMNQHIDIIDPLSGLPSKKGAKHFLVEQTRRMLENGSLILPKSEDTSVSAADQRMGLVQQMRNFRVEGYSVYGLPKYSQGQDHTLTAMYLACGGFYWKEGELKQPEYVRQIAGIEISDEVQPTNVSLTAQERARDAASGLKMTSYSGGRKAPNKDLKSRDLGGNVSRGGLSNLKGNLEARDANGISKKGIGYNRNKF